MVHFYHEIGPEELYEISSSRLADLEQIADALRGWLRNKLEPIRKLEEARFLGVRNFAAHTQKSVLSSISG
jgi:hypothetical protein